MIALKKLPWLSHHFNTSASNARILAKSNFVCVYITWSFIPKASFVIDWLHFRAEALVSPASLVLYFLLVLKKYYSLITCQISQASRDALQCTRHTLIGTIIISHLTDSTIMQWQGQCPLEWSIFTCKKRDSCASVESGCKSRRARDDGQGTNKTLKLQATSNHHVAFYIAVIYYNHFWTLNFITEIRAFPRKYFTSKVKLLWIIIVFLS